mmetsp:Transcript_34281/g.24792  ORF Transcript_34281/g.24792 Transcript_34281/m.24792 type:complete len:91 (-) Transcript_34281:82-354(-)
MEKGTYSMPSGDSAAGAVFFTIMALVPGLTWCMALIPFVMVGRIYYHCHWICDTICGVFIGVMWTITLFSNFNLFLPMMHLVVGDQYLVS